MKKHITEWLQVIFLITGIATGGEQTVLTD